MKTHYYRNVCDSVRAQVFQQETGWNLDIYDRVSDSFWTFAVECGDVFRTKKEALQFLRERCGAMKAINPQGPKWTEGEAR
jgi:hypothetical protein